MNFFENITMRRRRTRTKSDSITAINESQNETFDDTVNSLPDLSSDCNNDSQQQQIRKLKEQIDNLELELSSAHQEIESLSLENNNLKQVNFDLQGKNEMYKKLIQSPVKKLKNSTPSKNCLKTHKQTQTDASVTTNKREHKMTSTDIPKTTTVRETQQHSTEGRDNFCSSLKMKQTSPKVSPSLSYKTDTTGNRNKLCIISSNNFNKILPIAEDTLPNFELCHYLKTNCGIENLINNLHMKLANYSERDFCVIFIGEEDFRITKNYTNLIVNIRETLTAIRHTNIIICLPTYKCSEYTSMFNWRIEVFNNMLYLDNQTHQYAFLLDSNLELTYEMFSYYTGRLSNNGMKNICHHLDILITDIRNTLEITQIPENNMTPKKRHITFGETDLTTNSMDFFRTQ